MTDNETPTPQTIAAIIRAIEPEFVDDRARLKKLELLSGEMEGRVNELMEWSAKVTDWINAAIRDGQQPRLIEEGVGVDVPPPTVDELMSSLYRFDISVRDYAKFVREMKKGEGDGEVGGEG